MKTYHVLEEIFTFSSLIVHKDHTKLDYIPLSARKQQSRFRETPMLPTGLLREEERIDDDWIRIRLS